MTAARGQFEHIFKERSIIPGNERPSLSLGVVDSGQTDLVLKGVAGKGEEPHILYFPAEYDGDLDKEYLASGFLERGGGFFWVDYRNLVVQSGLSALNEVSQQGVALFSQARTKCSISGPTVVMGRGLGTIPSILAAHAYQDQVLCLLLESAFEDTRAYLEAMGLGEGLPPSPDPFELKKKVSEFKKAILFMHSHRDSVVPISSVEWLVCESRSKATQFQIMPSEDRWDLAYRGGKLYFDMVWQFIGLRMGRRPARRPRDARRQAT